MLPWEKVVFSILHLHTILQSIFYTNWSAISSANLKMLADAQTSLFDLKELGFYLFCPFFIDKTSCYFQGKQFKGCKICDEIKIRATVYKLKKILIKLFLSSEIFSDVLHLMIQKFFFDKLSISLSLYIQFHKSLRRMPDHTVDFVN